MNAKMQKRNLPSLLEMNPSRINHLQQTAIWTAVGIALLALIYLLGPTLTPFLVAAAFAYICNPAVEWLVRHRFPRPLAVFLVILGTGLFLILILLILIPMVMQEGATLISRLPELADQLRDRLVPLAREHLNIDLSFDLNSVRNWVTENSESAKSMLPELWSRARQSGSALISVIVNLVLIPVVMFYLLQEWPRLMRLIRDAIPRPLLERTMRILGEIDSVLSQFLRGQLLVMLALAVYYSVTLWIVGLNFALPIGIITGLLAFVPFVGFGGGLTLSILAALLQGDGWPLLIGVGVVFTIGQLGESYLLTPYLVGERIGLHPLAVIFALMAFGQLFGFVGMLIALPASAAILVGLREVSRAWFSSSVYQGNQPIEKVK